MKPFDPIVVSATEPKNKANIWIKHGKNLFNAVIEQGGISDLGADNTGNNRLRTLEFIFLKKGTYTLSFSGLEYSGGYLYNTNGTFNKLLWAWTTGNKTFTIENDSLMRFTFRKSDNAEITPDVIKNIQIEVGTEATEYEQYLEPDIFVNNNGVYNSVLTQDITTGVEFKTNKKIDGKDIYYKKINLGTGPSSSSKTYAIGINFNNIIDANVFAKSTSTFLKLPFTAQSSTEFINYYFTGTNVIIQVGKDRSNFNLYLDIYYTK